MATALREVSFGLDDFSKPKAMSIKESIAQIILNVLFMRPGNLPSMPWIGINIQRYVYMLEDEVDIDKLKSDIYSQCKAVLSFVDIESVEMYFTPYNGSSVLIINIPINIDGTTIDYMLGFAQDSMNSTVKYNFQVEARKAS